MSCANVQRLSILPKMPGLQLGVPSQKALTRASALQSGETLSQLQSKAPCTAFAPLLCDDACLCQVRIRASAAMHLDSRTLSCMLKIWSFSGISVWLDTKVFDSPREP